MTDTAPPLAEAEHAANPTTFLVFGAVAMAIAGGALAARDSELRRVIGEMLTDAELRATCADAGKRVGVSFVSAWRRAGGTAALIGSLSRAHSSLVA